MWEALVPREKVFFELFCKLAGKVVEAAEALQKMLGELERAEIHARRIKAIEHEADEIAHQTVERIHKTFVTPFDRHDIHQLVTRLDDIVDLTKAVAERLFLFEIAKAKPEALELSRILVESSQQVQKLVAGLERAKKDPAALRQPSIEINRLENDGDVVLRQSIAHLFREEPDIRAVVKWKEVYETLEAAIDRCEHVAHIVEGIVLELG